MSWKIVIFEQKEELSITTKILTIRELFDIVHDKKHPENLVRFGNFNQGGVFQLYCKDWLDPCLFKDEDIFFSVVKVSDLIVGIASLRKSMDKDRVYVISTVSVDPEFKNKGYSSLILEEVFRFAKERGFSLEGTDYEDEGRLKLKSVLNRLAEKYEVNFIDPDDKVCKFCFSSKKR